MADVPAGNDWDAEAAALLPELLPARGWRLSRPDGGAVRLMLAADGTVQGYDHPNERRWALCDDHLDLLHEDGRVSTRFDVLQRLQDGELHLEGWHLLEEGGPLLCLDSESQPPPAPAWAPMREAYRHFVDHHGWTIGDHSYGTSEVVGAQWGRLTVGAYCSFGSHTTLVLAQHNHRFASTYPFALLGQHWPGAPAGVNDHVVRDLLIGNDVWVGNHATLMGGLTVGDGAIVAAHAVVTHDVPPYAIVAGVPARVIGHRFDGATIARLLRLRWWDWPQARVNRMLPLMMCEALDAFLDAAEAEDGLPGLRGHPGPREAAESAEAAAARWDPQAAALLPELLPRRRWRLWRPDGSAPPVRLLLAADGTVQGYSHPNERRWALHERRLDLLHEDGYASTSFTRLARLPDGELHLEGEHLLGGGGLALCLDSETVEARWLVPGPLRDVLEGEMRVRGWRIGDYSYGTPEVVDPPPQGGLVVGAYCSIASGVAFVLGQHDLHLASTFPFTALRPDWPGVPAGAAMHRWRGPLVIGNDVWIGRNATVMGGITIGDGAVVAAQAVVTHDVAPYAIVAGVPARVVGHRFPPPIVARLLRLRWWSWERARVDRMLPLMLRGDMGAFLDAAEAEDRAGVAS